MVLPRLLKGEHRAKNLAIRMHMRLAITLAARQRRYRHSDPDLIPEAFLALTEAVKRIAEGCLTQEKKNVTGYITAYIAGRLKRFYIKNRLAYVDPKTYHKLQKKGKTFSGIILMSDKLAKIERAERPDQDNSDLMEIVTACIRTPEEKQMLELRMQGFNDIQIAERMISRHGKPYGKTGINEMRKKLANRVREKLEQQ